MEDIRYSRELGESHVDLHLLSETWNKEMGGRGIENVHLGRISKQVYPIC